ncbi:MAG: ferritin-like domain-containing protein [Aestuariivirga sp.]
MNMFEKVKPSVNRKALRLEAVASANEASTKWETPVAINQCLAHVLDLQARNKTAHWAAKSGNFDGLHTMFGDFSNELGTIADELSGRVVALGGAPAWLPATITGVSKLPPYPAAIAPLTEHFEALIGSYDAASRYLPSILAKVTRNGDHATANAVTSLAKVLDKQRHFIASQMPVDWTTAPLQRSAT